MFGLLAAWTGDLNLLSPWLLIAYALFASAMTVGALVAGPWAKSVAEAALASPTDAPSPERGRQPLTDGESAGPRPWS